MPYFTFEYDPYEVRREDAHEFAERIPEAMGEILEVDPGDIEVKGRAYDAHDIVINGLPLEAILQYNVTYLDKLKAPGVPRFHLMSYPNEEQKAQIREERSHYIDQLARVGMRAALDASGLEIVRASLVTEPKLWRFSVLGPSLPS